MLFDIRLNLALALVLVLGTLAVGIAASFIGLSSLNNNMASLVNGPVERLQIAQDIRTSVLELVRAQKNLILEEDSEKMKVYDLQIDACLTRIERLLSEGEATTSPEGRPDYAAIRLAWRAVKVDNPVLRRLALKNQNAEATSISFGVMRKDADTMIRGVEHLVALTDRQIEAGRAAARRAYQLTCILLACDIILAVATAVLCMIWVPKAISRSIDALIGIADAAVRARFDQSSEMVLTIRRQGGSAGRSGQA